MFDYNYLSVTTVEFSSSARPADNSNLSLGTIFTSAGFGAASRFSPKYGQVQGGGRVSGNVLAPLPPQVLDVVFEVSSAPPSLEGRSTDELVVTLDLTS